MEAELSIPFTPTAVREAMLKKGVILIYGEINEEIKSYVLESLCRLEAIGSPKIEIYFDSSGGNVLYGLHIYDNLLLYKGEKVGTVRGRGHSMASIILQACSSRRMTRNSKMALHYGVRNLPRLNAMSQEALVKEQKSALYDSCRMEEIYLKKATVSLDELKIILLKDETHDSEAIHAFGLIDQIID